MQLLKRVPLVVPVVLIVQLVFAAVASAQPQPGNGLLAAGNYHITTREAHYFFCCGDRSLPQLSVDVTDTTTKANHSGPPTTTHETDVFVNACGGTNFICGGGCFIAVGAGDFASSGLTSAELKTSYDPATSKPCQDRPVSGLPAFTVDVTWSGMSPVGTTRKTSKYSCAGYDAEVQTTNSNDNATANATSSLLGDSTIAALGASLGSTEQHWHAKGVALDACSSLGLGGGGKGAGPGPTGSGVFEFTNQFAGANVPGAFVELASFTKTSTPTGGPSSTVGETELTVVQFGFQFQFLCFALLAPNKFAFGSGLASASVDADIDGNTPACIGFTNQPFAPFSVHVTWTATGPLASIKTTGTSNCGAFHQVLRASDSTNPSSASGTVSSFPNPVVTTSQASINSSDRQFDLQGVAPQGCILRL